MLATSASTAEAERESGREREGGRAASPSPSGALVMSGVVKARAGVHSGRHNASLHSRAGAGAGTKRGEREGGGEKELGPQLK